MIAEEQDTPRTFGVTVEGTPLSVTVTPGESTEAGVVQVTVDGQAFSVTVTTGDASADAGPAEAAATPAQSPAPTRPASRPQPARSPAPQAAPTAQATPGERLLTAPMPGTVVRYTVAESQRVAAGETVVVLEAMKMENTLPAPVAGDRHAPVAAGRRPGCTGGRAGGHRDGVTSP